ncbi:hypothetical protein KJ966_15250 [bacterium]|nr:hypothetical protein [bacterium]
MIRNTCILGFLLLVVLSGCAPKTTREVITRPSAPREFVEFYATTPIYFDDGMAWVKGDPVNETVLGDVYKKEYQTMQIDEKQIKVFRFIRQGRLYSNKIPDTNIVKPGSENSIINPTRSRIENFEWSLNADFSLVSALAGKAEGVTKVKRQYELSGIYTFLENELVPKPVYCNSNDDYWYVSAIHVGSLSYNGIIQMKFSSEFLGMKGNEIAMESVSSLDDLKTGGLVLKFSTIKDACQAAQDENKSLRTFNLENKVKKFEKSRDLAIEKGFDTESHWTVLNR